MEHSVCKVSLAHHTKEWLSALFEALDGLELSVNNYLFTLLWIACRNKRLSHHLYRAFSSKFPPRHNLLWCTERRNGKWRYSLWSHETPFWAHLPLYSCGWGRVSCQDSAPWFLELACLFFSQFHKLKQDDQLSGGSSPCDRCYIWVELLGHLFCLSFSNFFFFKSKQRTFFDPWLFQFI